MVIGHLQQLYGDALQLFLVGYSAGSCCLMQILRHFRSIDRSPVFLKGGMCVCVCGSSYREAVQRLESEWWGKHVYSYSVVNTLKVNANLLLFSTLHKIYALKDIVRSNSHVHDELVGGRRWVSSLLDKAFFISEYDRVTCSALYGLPSLEQMQQSLSTVDLDGIVPLLILQPADDPLHIDPGTLRANMCLEQLVANPSIVYMEPQYGSHFGFIEASSTASYTYPAKIAVSFFDVIAPAKRKL